MNDDLKWVHPDDQVKPARWRWSWLWKAPYALVMLAWLLVLSFLVKPDPELPDQGD